MSGLSLVAALLAAVLTVLTFRVASGSRRLARDTHAVDLRLRRSAGRIRLGEQITAGQRMKEDVAEASATAAQVSSTAAVGVAKLVNSVVRGVAAKNQARRMPPGPEPEQIEVEVIDVEPLQAEENGPGTDPDAGR